VEGAAAGRVRGIYRAAVGIHDGRDYCQAEAGAAVVVAAGGVTVSLTATIFFEGPKAGLLTFGGAYTVIPSLREAAVENHHRPTSGEFNDGLSMGGALVMTVGIFTPAFVFPIFLHRLHGVDRPRGLRGPQPLALGRSST
jgi:hypothetical protein